MMKSFVLQAGSTLVGTALAITSVGSGPPASKSAPSVTKTVVARGLDAPKYPTLTADGLYVPESGTGGSHCVVGVANTSVTRVCAGATGSIVRIRRGRMQTVARGLASASVASTHAVSGVTSVAFSGGRLATLFNDGGVGPTGVSGVAHPYGGSLGKLYPTARSGGHDRAPVDLAAFAATHPQAPADLGGVPGETLYDADPHDMVAYDGGFAVVDAAANDVLRVSSTGRVSVLARLATKPETAPAGTLGPGTPAVTIDAQAVPSSITVGPDGALYVGMLRGAPSLPGTAEVDRIVPGHKPTRAVTGLSRVSDIAFDPQGRLVILESSGAGTSGADGALLRANLKGCAPVRASDLEVRGLHAPVGLAIGSNGTAYVTNNTADVGKGEVLALNGLGHIE